jgi:hypothetical protein
MSVVLTLWRHADIRHSQLRLAVARARAWAVEMAVVRAVAVAVVVAVEWLSNGSQVVVKWWWQ